MNFEEVSIISFWILAFLIYLKTYELLLGEDKDKIKKIVSMMNVFSFFVLNYIINVFIFENSEETTYIWPLIITLLFWGLAHIITQLKTKHSDRFNSRKAEITNGLDRLFPVYKSVSTFSNKDIPIYPRVTIYDRKGSEYNKEMFFDSSDFEVINKSIGIFNGDQSSFSVTKPIKINNKNYSTKSVKVDFINVFDDYSNGHTEVYNGINTPYNIQLIVEVEELEKI